MSDKYDFESLLTSVDMICNDVLKQRGKLYGNAWEHSGLQGIANQMFGKQQRLKELVLKRSYGYEYTKEEMKSIFDTLIDLINYSRMAAVCLAEGLWYFDDDQRKDLPNERLYALDVLRSAHS